MKRLKWIVPIAIWALLLLPFFLGAPAAHPATDDFTFAVYTRPTWVETGSLPHVIKDALSYSLRTWRDWQGTITGVIIMALNPAVFSIAHYGVHAVILLLLNLAAWYVFFSHMFVRRLGLNKRTALGLFGALSACLLLFLPDIVEGIYWFNGAWFYMGAQAMALFALVLCDRFSEFGGTRMKTVLLALVCVGMLFALGMDNYITAMMTAAALFMMALQRLWAKDRRAAIRTALMLLPIGAGLLIAVIAPGNAVRMERDGAHQSGLLWLVQSILFTLRDALGYIARFSLKTPLLAILLLITPLLCRQIGDPDKARSCPPVWATVLGYYLILCAMIIPHMYSSGYAGSGRVVNMYHCYVLTATPIAYAMVLMRFGAQKRNALAQKKAQRMLAAAAALAMIVCIAGGQLGNYLKLAGDQLNGTQAAYMEQIRNEYALCEAGGEGDTVVLPAWTVQTMTGKPTAYEDETMWTNVSMAQYFGVGSIRVGQ